MHDCHIDITLTVTSDNMFLLLILKHLLSAKLLWNNTYCEKPYTKTREMNITEMWIKTI